MKQTNTIDFNELVANLKRMYPKIRNYHPIHD